MDDVPQIVDFAKVVEPFLNGRKLLTYSGRYLTKPGDNYGSVLLAIDAEVQTSTDRTDKLSLVAKLPPLTNEVLWQMFQPERTCLTENAIYEYLSPAIRELQLEHGIGEEKLFDGFAKYYGSRISLTANAEKSDRDALLVLENLQVSGYCAGNRHKMFDLIHAKLILNQVARFHALPLALRIKRPEVFDKNIRPFFRRFDVNSGVTEENRIQYEEELYGDVIEATGGDQKILQRIRELVDEFNNSMLLPERDDGLFSTIAHCDMWVNNLMIKYDECGLPCKVKLVDFQLSQYESLAIDIIFFMFSSVEISVLNDHFDELLLHYYSAFIECLQSVGISTEKYSYVTFLKEVDAFAPISITSALLMIRIILADESTMPENFKDMNLDILTKNTGNKTIIQRIADIIRLAIKHRFFYKN